MYSLSQFLLDHPPWNTLTGSSSAPGQLAVTRVASPAPSKNLAMIYLFSNYKATLKNIIEGGRENALRKFSYAFRILKKWSSSVNKGLFPPYCPCPTRSHQPRQSFTPSPFLRADLPSTNRNVRIKIRSHLRCSFLELDKKPIKNGGKAQCKLRTLNIQTIKIVFCARIVN